MNHLIWSLPSLVVAGAIGIGRIKTTYAAALGLAATILIARMAAALPFGPGELAASVGRGAWVGATIAPYIFGGLIFWQFALHDAPVPGAAGQALAPADAVRSRRLSCAAFLVGPFAEAATGAGVGMHGTVILLRRLRIAPRHLTIFALPGHTAIPWCGVRNGTLLASTCARLPTIDLALNAVLPTAAALLVWLPLFRRTARRAGFGASWAECMREVGWIAAGMGLIALGSRHTNGSGDERQVYAMLWPYALAVLVVVQVIAALATSPAHMSGWRVRRRSLHLQPSLPS